MFKACINGVELTEEQLRDGLEQIALARAMEQIRPGDFFVLRDDPAVYMRIKESSEDKIVPMVFTRTVFTGVSREGDILRISANDLKRGLVRKVAQPHPLF